MKPTLRSALGFAVARVLRVAADSRLALRRTLRQTALLAVLCAFGAASLCHAIEAQTIAINFASDKATLGSGKVGFTKTLTEGGRTLNLGQELSSALWYASRDGSGSNITVKGALSTDTTEGTGRSVTLAFSANGTWNSSNNKTSGSLIGQLTHGYLDNGSSSQNSVTISNLPTTGYDVAIILSGDGYDGDNRKSAPNYTFSPIAVNDVNYTADEENGTYPGDACWGKRDSSTSLTEGVNVLFVRNVMTSTLTLRGYYLDTTTRKGRGTIAALMIFIHDTEGNATEQTVSATATAESTLFSGTGLTWTNGASETVTTLGPNTAATLALPSATTLALDHSVDLQSLALTGEGSLTLSTYSKGGLSAASTSVGANLDVSAKEFGASLGAVTVAANKTLTLRSLEQITSSSGTGTLALCGDSTIANTTKLGSGVPIKVSSGTVTYTAGDTGNGLSTGRFITVSGENSTLKTTTKDAFGWNFPTANAQKLIIEQGGRLELGSRETLVTPVELCAGHIVLTAAEGDRALDFFDSDATRKDITVKAAAEGASAENPTVSTLSSTGTGDARKVNLRNGDLRVEVEENAKFEVKAQLISYSIYGSTLGKLVKLGDGVLELGGTPANTYTPGTEIQAGTVYLTGAATLGTGGVTIASGAKLLVDGATDGTIKALTNIITGASAESIGTLALANDGVLDVRRALTGATVPTLAYAEGATGTLILAAGQERGVTIPEGAEARIVLSNAQLRSSYATTNTGNVTFYKETASGALEALGANDGTFSEDGKTFTAVNVWTNATGDSLWSTDGNWSTGARPGDTDTVKVMVDAQTTLTLPEDGVTVANLMVEATAAAGALTLSGGKLTVSGTLTVDAAVTATESTLAYGTLALQEGKALSLTVAAGATYASGQLTGTGTLAKLGTGTLQFTTAVGKACFADGATVDVQAGKLAFVEDAYTSPALKDATLRFAEGALWESYGWPKLEGTVTIEVVGSTNTLRLTTTSTYGVSLAGSGTLVKAGEGTLQLPVKTDNNAWSGAGEIRAGTLELLAADNGSSQEGTIGGVLSGSGKLKIGSGTVTLTGDERTGDNAYTGGTTIADGAKVIVKTIGTLGPSGTVRVEDGGTLKLVNSSDLNEEGTNYSRVTGTGTVWYSSSGGDYYRILPNTAAKRLPTTISVWNDLTAGLIISQQGTNSPETAVGSVSGSGTFRTDWNGGNNSRSLRIVQSKNTEHTGNFIYNNFSTRLTKVIVAGADGATEKTLTLAGDTTTTTARPLEIDSSGSVKLTGSWNAKITINGALEVPVESGEKTISTVLAGTTGTLTKSGAGTLKLAGANTFSGQVAITGGILDVGTNRGFTVRAIESDAKLALSPTASEREAGQISLAMADGVTLSAEQLSVTGFPGVTGAGGVIALPNPCWKPTAQDATWEHNWYRGTTAIATVPTSGEIEVNFSALTTETAVNIPSGTFEAVTFVGGEAEGCSLVVTLGEEVALGALTVSGRVTLPDTAIAAATEVTAGATLSLTGSGATISTAITGAGSLCQRSGETSLTGAKTYTGTTTVAVGATLSLAGNGVLSDAFGDGSAVVVDGTLKLADGSYCRRTTGAGTIRVLNDLTFAIGQAALPAGEQWSDEKTTGLTGFTGTLALVGNLKLTNAASADYTYAPTGFSVRFEDDGQGSSDGKLLCDETGKTSFTLAAGRTLSGKGFVKCPIAFEANSVIEVKTATNLDLKEATITLPSGEGEHILLKADVASIGFLYPATSANVPASVFAFAADSIVKSADARVNVYRYPAEWQYSYDIVQVLANPTVSGVDGDVAVAVAEAVRDQANYGGMPVTVTTVVADTETTPKADVKGALFFENVVATEMNYSAETGVTYTAKVTYDFGVSAITVKRLTLTKTPELCVVVCAKVESSAIEGTKATFKESAQVQLYLNDVLCNAATALTSAIDNSVDDSDKSVRWFAVPFAKVFPKESPTGTKNFTVKVTEATL
ncbi:MAG: autotransporter-associated beta strand repeat-containing protein [Lentisphaeraceae bacterium]|nr:autotransporter-associated beta strand repeat-containing protein [Lentisphaeraceae bacterium]